MEIFESFFGTTNPFHIALDDEGCQIPMIDKIASDLHKDYVTDAEVKAKDMKISLWCTLNEFFHGSKKTVQYTRFSVTGSSSVQIGFGAKVSNERVIKEIDVMPGMRDGVTLRFEGWGNNPALKRQGDLLVILRRIDHPTITRSVDNLIYKHKISLADALTSAPVEFETLDGEKIRFCADEVISPQTCKVFPGKGMPIYNDDPLSPLMHNHSRGDFVLKFEIELPRSLSDTQREQLSAVLAQ